MGSIDNYRGTAYRLFVEVESISSDMNEATILVYTNDLAPTEAPTASCGGNNNFKVHLGIDNYGGETAWTLKEKDTGLVVASGSVDQYSSGQEYFEPSQHDSYCLEDNTCYTFTITDTYGDGICCSYGQGYYKGMLEGSEIFSGGKFSDSETKEFCTDGPTIPIEVAPTDAPTNAPVVAPTNAPVVCKDKTSKFQYFNGQGKKLKKKCKWVAKKSSSRCKIVTNTGGLVSDFCPKTCGKC